jgi:hypothetical protein
MLTAADINSMKTAELRKTLIDLTKAGNSPTPQCDMTAILNNIMVEIKKGSEERASLKAEIAELKKANEDLLAAINSRPSPSSTLTSADVPKGTSFADVVRSSVRSALDDERHLKEVVISKVQEQGRDDIVVSDLCEKMDFKSRPTEVKRLGKKPTEGNRQRLIKVTFPSAFDSRAFLSRFNETKKADDTLSHIKVRPGRTKEDHENYKKSVAIAYKLNDEAKKSSDQHQL